jgi:ceramide glucosyltransferase
VVSALLLAWAGVYASTVLWATLRAMPRKRGSTDGAEPLGRVLLVRPCAGAEPLLERALASTGPASRALGAVVRFAVASPADPAADTARRVAAALRGEGIDAGVDFTFAAAPNRKAAQLARVLEDEPTSDVVVVADSDVELDPSSLEALTAPLRADRRVAAVWAVPIETRPRTLADRASASVLDASLQCFALLSVLDAGGMVGKLFAVRTRALESVGGFAALSRCLGEDMELARRLRAQGHAVVVAAASARSIACGRTCRQVVGRYTRWIHVIRGQRTALLATYPLLMGAMPLLVVGGALAGGLGEPPGFVAAIVAVLARAGAAIAARTRTGGSLSPVRLVRDALLADAVLLAAFALAVFARRIEWRGTVLRHAPGGLVEEVPS